MKLLMVGDSLQLTAGVVNYTRPLFYELQKKIDVAYLYSGNYTAEYDFSFKPKVVEEKPSYFVLRNPIIKPFNSSTILENKLISVQSELDQLEKFLNDNKFTHVHIHSMLGFNHEFVKLCLKNKLKVFVTVHEYWWLCIHRVMIDYNQEICEGPSDISKCSLCVSLRYRDVKHNTKIKLAIRKNFPSIFSFIFTRIYLPFKKNVFKYYSNIYPNSNQNLSYQENEFLRKSINERLINNIDTLNQVKVIAVSREVKEILSKYGVNQENIVIQHIGSLIASQKIFVSRNMNPKKIVFGFIGGVTFYKGIHVLVKAYLRLNKIAIDNSELLIYGKYQEDYISAIKLENGSQYGFGKIKFFGKYSTDDLKKIYSNIDIMVLPSVCNDTAPQTIFESFAAGIPIIASNIGGFPDFIEHNKNGLLFETGNSEDLKEKMEYILENPDKIKEYREKIPELKTIEKNAQELIEIYTNI